MEQIKIFLRAGHGIQTVYVGPIEGLEQMSVRSLVELAITSAKGHKWPELEIRNEKFI